MRAIKTSVWMTVAIISMTLTGCTTKKKALEFLKRKELSKIEQQGAMNSVQLDSSRKESLIWEEWIYKADTSGKAKPGAPPAPLVPQQYIKRRLSKEASVSTAKKEEQQHTNSSKTAVVKQKAKVKEKEANHTGSIIMWLFGVILLYYIGRFLYRFFILHKT